MNTIFFHSSWRATTQKVLPIFCAITFALGAIVACTNPQPVAEPIPEKAQPGSDFALFQEKVLTPNCATSGCHDTRNAVGGLDLSADVAFKNLISVQPTNPNAQADKLLRITPNDPYRSFLYVKLDSANLHNSDGYGSRMPLGSRSLPAGQLEFLRLWIANGAKASGNTVDANLLIDTRPQNEVLMLSQPSSGMQIQLPQFSIVPRFEREINYAVQSSKEILITKFDIVQRDRSHHFILYKYPQDGIKPPINVFRDLYDTKGVVNEKSTVEIQDRIYVMGSQLKNETIEFPPGMAMRLPANSVLDLNSHYTNGLRDTIRGEAVINLHSTTPDKVTTYIQSLQLGRYDFVLSPKRETVVETTFIVGAPTPLFVAQDTFEEGGKQEVNIIALTSHNHRLGKRFIIQIVGGARNGEVVFSSTNWLNPPLIKFNTPIKLKRGEGLKSIVTYFNDTDKDVRYGVLSSDEMDFIFGYYY